MRAEHEHLRFQNSCMAKGQVHGHLVAVKVGIESGTCQGVKLDGFTLDKLGLECLDTQTVQGRGTVQQHRMSFHHIFEDIPDHGIFPVHNLLGGFNGLDDTSFNEFSDDERFVQFSRHIFGQTAFVHIQFWTYHND